MFGKKPWDNLVAVLGNPTIPRFYFPGLALEDSEFLNLQQLIELDKKEVYEKLLKLRDISNSMIGKEGYILGVEYSEEDEPKLNILFNKGASENFNITDWTRLRGNRNSAPSYKINEAILNYLLENKNLKSKLDMMLVSEYIEELTAFKEALLAGTFYPNYKIKDTTGEFDISVSHNGYHVEEVRDSIEIPYEFGRIMACREFSGGYGLKYVYNAHDNYAENATNIEGTSRIAQANEILYLHKKLLPEKLQKKI